METGEGPLWARPAVDAIESKMVQRGLEASTVGRDALVNAIIQSAIPLAQSNAQAIQQSVARQQTIEAQESEANTARRQQTALTNAQNVFNLNLAQIAIKFCEIKPFVTSVIIGATTMQQLKTNIESVNVNLSEEILKSINNVQKLYPNPCP